MRAQSMSILTGNARCNASCPFCISRMTPKQGVCKDAPLVNWRNFDKACRLAELLGTTSVLLTGKGEPTLFPDQITHFLVQLDEYNFPIIELQTNGLLFEDDKYDDYLKEWYDRGLTFIALSVVHYDYKVNKSVYTPNGKYMDLEKVIEKLHRFGFSVRLSCTMIKGGIDSFMSFKNMVAKSHEWEVEQLSIRKLSYPDVSEDAGVLKWCAMNEVSEAQHVEIEQYLESQGTKLMTFEWGATVYDLNDQNVAITNALTFNQEKDDLRQLIFFPDGRLRYDWQRKGAILI